MGSVHVRRQYTCQHVKPATTHDEHATWRPTNKSSILLPLLIVHTANMPSMMRQRTDLLPPTVSMQPAILSICQHAVHDETTIWPHTSHGVHDRYDETTIWPPTSHGEPAT